MNTEKFEFANLLRGLAAFAVVISHLALGYWYDQATVTYFTGLPAVAAEPPAIARFFAAIPLNFGSFGVGLFFVISGFVIPYSLVAYDVKAFLVGRFFRIYPTFWAGVLISAAAALAGAAIFGVSVPFAARELLKHMLAPLRPILESRPVDGVVWTLEIELYFYVLCAFLARDIALGRRRLALVPFVIFAVWIPCFAMAAHPPAGYERLASRFQFVAVYLPMLILMFVGVAYNLHRRGKLGGREAAVWIAAFLGLFAATWASGFLGGDWKPLMWSVIPLPSYLVAVGSFFAAAALRRHFRSAPVLDFLADISYSLYVVHQLAGYVLLRLLASRGVEVNVATALTIGFTIALAFALHRLVEAPTHRYGQAMARRLAARMRASAEKPATS
ncbi:MAG TPA: acyltransferase [Rhodoblastus sp.]|nr:acyltransferase [Rhodoblastus sp.]